jgi:hypothetical protein
MLHERGQSSVSFVWNCRPQPRPRAKEHARGERTDQDDEAERAQQGLVKEAIEGCHETFSRVSVVWKLAVDPLNAIG